MKKKSIGKLNVWNIWTIAINGNIKTNRKDLLAP